MKCSEVRACAFSVESDSARREHVFVDLFFHGPLRRILGPHDPLSLVWERLRAWCKHVWELGG